MSAHMFENYLDFATSVAPVVPGDGEARAAYLLGLEIPELANHEDELAISQAVFKEGSIVANALRSKNVPTNRTVGLSPHDKDSKRGWYLTEVQNGTFTRIGEGWDIEFGVERRTDSRSLLLDEEGGILMYHRIDEESVALDGLVKHVYIVPPASFKAGDRPQRDRAILFGYALLAVEARITGGYYNPN